MTTFDDINLRELSIAEILALQELLDRELKHRQFDFDQEDKRFLKKRLLIASSEVASLSRTIHKLAKEMPK